MGQTWKEMEAGCTPKLESWRCSLKTMGFEMSMVAAWWRKSMEGRRRLWVGRYRRLRPLVRRGEMGERWEDERSDASWRHSTVAGGLRSRVHRFVSVCPLGAVPPRSRHSDFMQNYWACAPRICSYRA
jgi:hypothetical protein